MLPTVSSMNYFQDRG
uniref:Uncharacterized protein n=1 Tax=Arundo donax TaxID=35708 RepID=A0A0A9HGT9_ARUDO